MNKPNEKGNGRNKIPKKENPNNSPYMMTFLGRAALVLLLIFVLLMIHQEYQKDRTICTKYGMDYHGKHNSNGDTFVICVGTNHHGKFVAHAFNMDSPDNKVKTVNCKVTMNPRPYITITYTSVSTSRR